MSKSENKIHSIKYNFLMNFLLKISSMLFPLITYPYVSRILMPEGIGKISFASSIIAYFSMFAVLGVPTYGVKSAARVRDDKEALSRVVHELMFIMLVMSVIVYLTLGFSLTIIDKFESNKTVIIVTSFQIILNVIGVDWLYSGLEQYTYITVRSVIFKLIGMLLMFMLVKDKDDVIVYAAITVFATNGSYLLNFVRLRKFITLRILGNYNFKRHIKPMLTFFAISIAVSIYTNLDTAMLGFMRNDYDVGIYNTAVKIKTILVTLVASLGTVLLPRLTYYLANDNVDEFNKTIKKSIGVVFFITVPIVAFFEMYASESILFLSGDGFLDAVLPMHLLLFNVILSALANITGMQILIPSNKEKVYLLGVTAGAVLDFALNLILIPRVGVMGAAIATVIAELSGLLIQIIYLKEYLINNVDLKNVAQVILCSALSAYLAVLVKRIGIDFSIVKLALGAVAYFSTYSILMLIAHNKIAIDIFGQIRSKVLIKGANKLKG